MFIFDKSIIINQYDQYGKYKKKTFYQVIDNNVCLRVSILTQKKQSRLGSSQPAYTCRFYNAHTHSEQTNLHVALSVSIHFTKQIEMEHHAVPVFQAPRTPEGSAPVHTRKVHTFSTHALVNDYYSQAFLVLS